MVKLFQRTVFRAIMCGGLVVFPASDLMSPGKPVTSEFLQKHTFFKYPHSVPRNTSMWEKLSDLGFSPIEIHQLVAAAKPIYNLSRVKPSMPFRVEGKKLIEFQLSQSQFLRIEKGEQGWLASEKAYPIDH